MTLVAGRNIHFYGIVAPFVLGIGGSEISIFEKLKGLESNLVQVEPSIDRPFWPALTLLICMVSFSSETARTRYVFAPSIFPVHATEWLQAHPQPGKMFNDLNWGGYLAFNLWPQYTVFADSMADTTGELTSNYESVITLAPHWEQILSNYRVEWAIIQPSSQLARTLESSGWLVLYEDKTAIILRNSSPP